MNYSVGPILLTLVAPLIVLILVGRIRLTLRRRREASLTNTPGAPFVTASSSRVGSHNANVEPPPNQPKPFDPTPEPTPNPFLRNFTLQQRTWIRQQLPPAKHGYFASLWILFVMLAFSLTPQYVQQWGPLLSPSQRALSSYVSNFEVVAIVTAIVAFITSSIAITAFQVPRQASFTRTRPLPYKFLFFTRIGIALASLLTAIVSALAISLSLLLIFYGFRHSAAFDTAIRPSQQEIVNFLLLNQTSLPRIVLSLLTTAILVYAVLVALLTLPVRVSNKSKGGILNFVVVFVFLFVKDYIRDSYRHHHPNSSFSQGSGVFLYLSLGPPPPWIEALIPLLLSAFFLWLAQKFSARTEV